MLNQIAVLSDGNLESVANKTENLKNAEKAMFGITKVHLYRLHS
jgi:hypothetical protein